MSVNCFSKSNSVVAFATNDLICCEKKITLNPGTLSDKVNDDLMNIALPNHENAPYFFGLIYMENQLKESTRSCLFCMKDLTSLRVNILLMNFVQKSKM